MYFNRQAFLGQVPLVSHPSLGQSPGQGMTPEEYMPEFSSYQDRAASIPGGASKQLQDTLMACEHYLTQPGMFSPMRVRGCLNSAMMQLQALGV